MLILTLTMSYKLTFRGKEKLELFDLYSYGLLPKAHTTPTIQVQLHPSENKNGGLLWWSSGQNTALLLQEAEV